MNIMMFYHLYAFLLFQIISQASCLNCMSCQHIANPTYCNTSVSCLPNEVCYLEGRADSFSMGCSSNQNCGAASSNIIGRGISETAHSNRAAEKALASRQTANCHECCSSDECNRDLCNHFNPTRCMDDETVDCAKMSTIFNICADIHKAKLVCVRFCNLCNLVDGQWGHWSSWSGCDVTCNHGKQVRNRLCNNPAPAHGGLNCTGDAYQTKVCNNAMCPVNGNWSDWSSWGSCSASCGIGLERRDRSCSNPPPILTGMHCFGDAHENRICYSTPCIDGSWSSWSSWSVCSETCGGGLRIKTRSCSYPPPSMLGKYCEGSTENVGMCNKMTCPDHRVAFTASGVAQGTNKTIRFPNVQFNSGGGYDSQTGKFTCTVPGIYQFTVTMTMKPDMAGHVFRCYLTVNGTHKLYIAGHKGTDDMEALEYSASGSFHLNKGETVSIVDSLLVLADANNDASSSFTGVLVIPDM